MPEPSNPTTRVMQVLGFLAAHPTEAFTLAEIARHVGLTNGSAHRLLTTLAAGQFLSRNERHRTYSLGVALVAIGQAAIEKHRGIDIARREIARLAVELNIQCSANAIVDGDIVVLVKEGTAQSHLGLTRVGERRPLVPPSGLCHLAWAGDAAIAEYIDRAGPLADGPVRERLRAAFPAIRERGFAIAAPGPIGSRNREAMVVAQGQVRDAAYWARVVAHIGQYAPDEVQLLDLADAPAAGVSYMAAPVFSPAGTVAFAIVMSGFARGLSGREIEGHAERLCAAAAVITSETHGRRP